jgi:hypothetical protein
MVDVGLKNNGIIYELYPATTEVKISGNLDEEELNEVVHEQVFKKSDYESLPFFFDLSGNDIEQLDKKLFSCSKTCGLRMDRNSIEEIPIGITQWKLLKTLSLADNKISELSQELFELESLEVLDLRDNKIKILPMQISKLLYLRVFLISNNNLNVIPSSIGDLLQLASFAVDHNPLTKLPETILNLPNLTNLNISSTKLTSLPDFTKMKKLNKLNVFDVHTLNLKKDSQLLNVFSKLKLDDFFYSTKENCFQMHNFHKENLTPIFIKKMKKFSKISPVCVLFTRLNPDAVMSFNKVKNYIYEIITEQISMHEQHVFSFLCQKKVGVSVDTFINEKIFEEHLKTIESCAPGNLLYVLFDMKFFVAYYKNPLMYPRKCQLEY